MNRPAAIGCLVTAFAVAAPAAGRAPATVPRAAAPCAEARGLVEQALALEFAPPCDAECLRQKRYFYARAVRLCPGDAVAQNNLGDVFERAGELGQAREHYARAVAADGTLAAAQFGLGDVALAAGIYDEAIRAYERGLVLVPAEAVSRCRLRLARAIKDGGAVDRTLAGACLADGGGARGPDPVLVPAARLPLRVSFVEGTADLVPGADAGLGEVAAALSTLDAARFRVEAYATPDESDDPAALARRRAERVRDLLVSGHGIQATRLEVEGRAADTSGHIEIVRVGPATTTRPPLRLTTAVLVENPEARLEPLAAGRPLPSGARYAVRFSASARAHVYVVQEDAAGHLARLFPNPDFGSGGNPVREGVDYFLPGGDRLFQLDDTVGTERVYVMASRLAARDVEDVIARLERAGAAGARDETLHEMVLQVRSRGVAGVVGRPAPAGRGALGVALARATDDDSTLSVIEFEHVTRSRRHDKEEP